MSESQIEAHIVLEIGCGQDFGRGGGSEWGRIVRPFTRVSGGLRAITSLTASYTTL